MSELTKIAAILFKNLSDALLTTASELKRLDSASPLSQTSQKQEFVSIIATMPTKRFTYQPRDRVIIKFENPNLPTKYRILKRLSDGEYLAYPQKGLKRDAKTVTANMIVGIDPDP